MGDNCVSEAVTEGPRFTPILELAFWSPFLLKGSLAQSRYGGRALILPQSYVTDFVDSHWEAFSSLKSR